MFLAVLRPLPFREPSFRIRHGSWILRIKSFRIMRFLLFPFSLSFLLAFFNLVLDPWDLLDLLLLGSSLPCPEMLLKQSG